MRGERYQEAEDLVASSDDLIEGADNRRALLLERISLLERDGKFAEALKVFEQFESIESKTTRQDSYNPAVYDPLEEILQGKLESGAPVAQAGESGSAKQGIEKQAKAGKSEAAPEAFALEAAYPNPFNPTATVPFALPEEARVRITVYDVMGRQVTTLTDRGYEAGSHRVTFEATGLASGLYLVRAEIQAASGAVHSFVRKVSLVK